MEQHAIFAPMLATLTLTMLVWVYMFARRIPFIQGLNLDDGEQVTAEMLATAPPSVVAPSDNLKNLFEIPPLFYVLCVYLYVMQQVDTGHVVLAWTFFTFRALHSIMHCTKNVVIVRFGLYAASTMAFFVMLVRAVIEYL